MSWLRELAAFFALWTAGVLLVVLMIYGPEACVFLLVYGEWSAVG